MGYLLFPDGQESQNCGWCRYGYVKLVSDIVTAEASSLAPFVEKAVDTAAVATATVEMVSQIVLGNA